MWEKSFSDRDGGSVLIISCLWLLTDFRAGNTLKLLILNFISTFGYTEIQTRLCQKHSLPIQSGNEQIVRNSLVPKGEQRLRSRWTTRPLRSEDYRLTQIGLSPEHKGIWNGKYLFNEVWLSLVEHLVWDQGVASSNLVTSTMYDYDVHT